MTTGSDDGRPIPEWDQLADWWLGEVADPAYEHDVQPLLDMMTVGLDGPSLDMGCGDGRLVGQLPEPVVGCDLSRYLLEHAGRRGMAVVQTHLPNLGWLRSDSIGVAVACLVLEHLPDAVGFFEATARVVRPGGSLVVVSNHPAYTSGGAGPVIDQSDGEVLWRWGSYMFDSISAEPAGTGSVVFHHRSLGSLLTTAARAGWDLRHVAEAGAADETIQRVPALEGQEHMPRLIGLRWSRPAL
jgi:SAM-dependent methyltransferase